ncbi:sensor histidine kinase [Comamonas resistens]|uniref:histidine kinase n=1 Tax=Comamonas resistens TaxID=3046670 RepID=A0ABY8SUA9_9BURK|nr:ATP-binding protein [Comamonas resistens]MDL5038734.1 ATP-binding protein [Comamonas resistens]WHS65904.1 ATP-binding protein [Comamonas resistens]
MPDFSALDGQGGQLPPRWSRATRWAVGVGVVLMVVVGIMLLFLLTMATNNRLSYERNYNWLFAANVLVAGLLLLVLLWGGLRLALRLKRGRFGSKLLLKLAGIFTLVGLLPGLLIYVVSYQFVSRSIESWFDVKVEGALTAGVSLASATLDTVANDMANNTRTAGLQLSQVSDAGAALMLERIRDQIGASDVVLWNASGKAIASAGKSQFSLAPERPSAQMMRSLREQGGQRAVSSIEGLDDADDLPAGNAAINAKVRTLALVPSSAVNLLEESRYLQATIALPETLVRNALAVQEANREYQERALARAGLQRMYIGTLTLALFLAVFGAVVLAIVLGNQLAKPLLLLAQGMRDVARGDLRPKPALSSKDEIGGLTRSFAVMTQQLADARSDANRNLLQLDAARSNLQTILDNLTSGVIVLDSDGRIVLSNPGATRILREPMAVFQGKHLREISGLQDLARVVQEQFELFFGDPASQQGRERWQQVYELDAGDGDVVHNTTSLVMRGAELPDAQRLLVFDDISEIVSAQRAQAWGEVARRVAHEIKNPLTPIQLSAERMAMKLTDKLEPAEQALLTKSVKTIVDQVAAMKRLVDEFREYARLPAAKLQPMDINALVTEVLQLYGEENATVRVEASLDENCPMIRGDSQQLRQVIHNLLQNAQDSTAQRAQETGQTPGVVTIETRWVDAAQRVRLSISDSGTGFAPNILQRAFEPYVTTKTRGTGLGLAVVKKIADEHGARVDLGNREEDGIVQGARVSLSFQPNEGDQAG